MDFILDQLSDLDGITYRKMMGEYIIYVNEKIAAYICDDRFLIKPVPTAFKLISNAVLEPPYKGAKDMILIENVDDREFLCNIINAIELELSGPRKNMKK